MRQIRLLGIGIAVGAMLLGPLQEASALTGREIMERSQTENRADDEVFESTMHIVSSSGIRRERKFVTKVKAGENLDDKLLIRFLLPPDIRGTGLLTHEEGDTESQWLYLPDMKKTKRIAGSSKAGRFMGSDLSHCDMRTENLEGHTYELLGEETVAERPCYKVKATPKNDRVLEETGYGYRIAYIDKERWLPIKGEFFDRQLRPLKVLTTSEWEQVDGLWRSHRIEVEHQQEGSSTVVTSDKDSRKINKGLSGEEFNKRALEKP